MRRIVLPFTALAIALGLAACHQASTPADNAGDAAMIENSAAGDDNGTMAAADTSDDEAAAPDIAAPTVAADAPAEQSTPLVEAAQAAATIASDTSVTRVAWNDGWAWKRDGQIIRTASHDGGRVAYFHPGGDHPYLIQDGGHSYGYDDNGKLAHVYDHGGRPQKPSATDQHDADQFDRQARQDQDHARSAPPAKPTPPHKGSDAATGQPAGEPADQGDRNDHANGHDRQSPQPKPTPSSSRNAHDRGDRGNGDNGRPDDRNGPGH